ncbi:MAG: response regulator transcription factor [Micropruina glycogenica]
MIGGPVRRGICLVLDTLEGVEVVGEAADGREGLAMINAVQPDVVLTDARMPVLDGVGLVAGAASRFPGLPVVVRPPSTTTNWCERRSTPARAASCSKTPPPTTSPGRWKRRCGASWRSTRG